MLCTGGRLSFVLSIDGWLSPGLNWCLWEFPDFPQEVSKNLTLKFRWSQVWHWGKAQCSRKVFSPTAKTTLLTSPKTSVPIGDLHLTDRDFFSRQTYLPMWSLVWPSPCSLYYCSFTRAVYYVVLSRCLSDCPVISRWIIWTEDVHSTCPDDSSFVQMCGSHPGLVKTVQVPCQ